MNDLTLQLAINNIHEAVDFNLDDNLSKANISLQFAKAEILVEIARQLTRIADALERQNQLQVLGPDPEQ